MVRAQPWTPLLHAFSNFSTAPVSPDLRQTQSPTLVIIRAHSCVGRFPLHGFSPEKALYDDSDTQARLVNNQIGSFFNSLRHVWPVTTSDTRRKRSINSRASRPTCYPSVLGSAQLPHTHMDCSFRPDALPSIKPTDSKYLILVIPLSPTASSDPPPFAFLFVLSHTPTILNTMRTSSLLSLFDFGKQKLLYS